MFLKFCKILKIQLAHLEKCCKMSIDLQRSASIKPRTGLLKFSHKQGVRTEVPRGVCRGFAFLGAWTHAVADQGFGILVV